MANFFKITKDDIDSNADYFKSNLIPPNLGFPNIKNYKNVEFTYLPFEAFTYTIDDQKVIYKLNNHLFRSDEFLSNHNNQKHALFVGCSETFGVGAQEGTVWTNYVYDALNEHSEFSGHFVMGHPGQGLDLYMHNMFVYFEKFGCPDYIFMWLPNIERNIRYDEGRFKTILHSPHREHEILNEFDLESHVDNFKKDTFMDALFKKDEKALKYKFFSNKDYDGKGFVWDQIAGKIDDSSKLQQSMNREEYLTQLFKFREIMTYLEKFCEAKNIKLYWQLNRSLEEKYIIWMDCFNRFVPTGQDDSFDRYLENNQDKFHEYGFFSRRDNLHLGWGVHKFRAQKFMEAINNEKAI